MDRRKINVKPSPRTPQSNAFKPKDPPPLDLGEPSASPDHEETADKIFRPISPQPSIAEDHEVCSAAQSKQASGDEPDTPLRPTGKDLERARAVLGAFGRSPRLKGENAKGSPRIPGVADPKNSPRMLSRSASRGRSLLPGEWLQGSNTVVRSRSHQPETPTALPYEHQVAI